jgi:hypothetical protein
MPSLPVGISAFEGELRHRAAMTLETLEFEEAPLLSLGEVMTTVQRDLVEVSHHGRCRTNDENDAFSGICRLFRAGLHLHVLIHNVVSVGPRSALSIDSARRKTAAGAQ